MFRAVGGERGGTNNYIISAIDGGRTDGIKEQMGKPVAVFDGKNLLVMICDGVPQS